MSQPFNKSLKATNSEMAHLKQSNVTVNSIFLKRLILHTNTHTLDPVIITSLYTQYNAMTKVNTGKQNHLRSSHPVHKYTDLVMWRSVGICYKINLPVIISHSVNEAFSHNKLKYHRFPKIYNSAKIYNF
jgi:hypothetical protein